MRPVDLAREHGLSTQAVRNYEDDGILPAAERGAHGYRRYGPRHARALRAFVALVPAHGHGAAAAVMRAATAGEVDRALALIDESHAQLQRDRGTLAAVEEALRVRGTAPAATGPAFIGPLARQLRLRPATLRKWEAAGVLRPRRDPATGYRRYSPADVRDAHLAGQLRRAGYPLAEVARVVTGVRDAGGVAVAAAALADGHERLRRRGLAMLAAAGALAAYLREP